MVQIRLFGGVSATTDGGEPIAVGPAKCQVVLAALDLSPGSVVHVSRLVQLAWGSEAPRTAPTRRCSPTSPVCTAFWALTRSFVPVPPTIDRLPDAAHVLRHLETTGDFGALAARTLVADAASKIATTAQETTDRAPAPAQRLDDRHALEYMRDVLDQMLADGWHASTGQTAEDAP